MTIGREKAVAWVTLTTLVVCFTFLREVLILIYPLFALALGYVLGLRVTQRTLLFTLGFLLFGLLSSWLAGGYYFNFLVSSYLILPVWIFLQARPVSWTKPPETSLFKKAMDVLTVILAIVNVSAIIYSQLIIDASLTNYDDAFTGLYGQGGLGSHTLSVMNLGFSVYFLSRRAFAKCLFFLICGVFGFYGLGLIIFIGSLIILYATRILRYWKIILALALAAVLAIGLIRFFNERNLEYLKTNIERSLLVFESYDYDEEMEKASQLQITQVPRFITFMIGAQKRLLSSPKVLFLGTAPGGYNSRTAFYLNGDYVQNAWIKDNVSIRTPYHEEDVFSLLNRELLSRPYNDGTRNQTFSSMASLLLEYGVLIGGTYILLFFKRFWKISRRQIWRDRGEFLKFLSVYTFILLIFQNYLEYPEIIFPIVLFFKLAEVDTVNTFKKEAHAT